MFLSRDLRSSPIVLVVAALLAVACRSEPRGSCDDADPIRTRCGYENPEDLAYARGPGVVVVSQMRRDGAGGNLAATDPAGGGPRLLWPRAETPGVDAGPAAGDPQCPPPVPDVFAPHGLFVRDARLYVVNHGGRESVEIFALEGVGEDVGARWIGCVELPEGTSGNDVAVGPTGWILVSNMSPPGAIWTASLKSRFGLDTGDVILWRGSEGWLHVPGTDASGPNGVALSPGGEWIYYAEAGAGRIVRVRPDGSGRREGKVEGRPDNLSWSESGRLRVATHTSSLDLAWCLWRRPCRAPWKVFELDPETLEAREILSHDGARVGAVAGAQGVGDDVYLSAVFGDRIGIWTPSADPK